jgi:2-polyprenyl-6-methoxyphenol hydroxylase-like FAD-dependent oxidoreductase
VRRAGGVGWVRRDRRVHGVSMAGPAMIRQAGEIVEDRSVRCCIVGGGPAGMMLAYLLARASVNVVVLEKHGDFLRDFRGDTLHPSTLEVLNDVGLLNEVLALPHEEVRQLTAQVGEEAITIADFSSLPTRCKFVAMVPQWDFLTVLAVAARPYPNFRLEMSTDVTGLVVESGRVVGVRASRDGQELVVRADLVVGCDGRQSVVRTASGLPIQDLGAPIDVLWFRLSRKPSDPAESTGRVTLGRIVILIRRPEHWQCGYLITKGGFDRLRHRGLASFRTDIANAAPFLADRTDEIASWDDVPMLSVRVDRLRRWWRPGLLCIGDAAHAMSPVAGVGINLAVQDAVATANLLTTHLLGGAVPSRALAAVQRRRAGPATVTQRIQVLIQNRVLTRALDEQASLRPSRIALVLARSSLLRRIPSRLVGLGIRPERLTGS